MVDWQAIRTEYITTKTSYRKLAEKYGVNKDSVMRKAQGEDWQELRRQHADTVQAKILAADARRKTDRSARLMTVADKLLLKVEQLVDVDAPISDKSAKNLADALKSLKDVCMVRSPEDIREQKARIAKLEKESRKQNGNEKSITITLEGGLSDYAG